MPSKAAVTVSLTPQLQEFIASRISSGRYRSVSEVIREALRCLERQQGGEKMGSGPAGKHQAEGASR